MSNTPFVPDMFPNNLGEMLDAYDRPDCYGLILNKFLNDCNDTISSFFISRRDDIKNIYTAIRENKYPHNKIIFINIMTSLRMFNEYFSGLHEYAMNLAKLDSNMDISKDAIKKMVNDVEYKNSEFIDSIFGCQRNPEMSDTIDQAMMYSIEQLESLKLSCSSYNEKAKSVFDCLGNKDNSKYLSEITLGLRTYTTSIGDLAYCSMREMVRTYNSIMDSMRCRVPVNGTKDAPKYKIF